MKGFLKLPLLGIALAGLSGSPAIGEEIVSCDQIDWKQQILISFDGIQDACQKVIVRDGVRLVRFKVKFVNSDPDGDVHVLMYLRDGTRVERTFSAPQNFRASSESGNSDFRMNELDPGDVLDVDIPLSRVKASRDDR